MLSLLSFSTSQVWLNWWSVKVSEERYYMRVVTWSQNFNGFVQQRFSSSPGINCAASFHLGSYTFWNLWRVVTGTGEGRTLLTVLVGKWHMTCSLARTNHMTLSSCQRRLGNEQLMDICWALAALCPTFCFKHLGTEFIFYCSAFCMLSCIADHSIFSSQ